MDSKYGTLTPSKMNVRFPEDEPLFLIRGQDLAAVAAIRAYAQAAANVGASGDFVTTVHRIADELGAWQAEHHDRCKVPD